MSAEPDRPFDPGLQNERTALAWTRTALAMLAMSLLVARLATTELGILVWVLVAAGAGSAGWILRSSNRRYRHAHRALHNGTALPDGRLPAVMAALTVAVAVTELVAVTRP